MIKNLVVNGCSFTSAYPPNCRSWADRLQDKYQFSLYTNLAVGGSGNTRIAQSTIDYLQAMRLEPESTLVLIMWSGFTRIDMKISKDYQVFLRKSGYNFTNNIWCGTEPQKKLYSWVLSGGFAQGSWRSNSETKKLFEPIFKSLDVDVLQQNSYHCFSQLENYLLQNNYRFKFTSFVNQWNNKKYECFSDNNNYDFKNWKFLDLDRNCFGEYADRMGQLNSTNHPTDLAHARFAEEFFYPIVEEHVI